MFKLCSRAEVSIGRESFALRFQEAMQLQTPEVELSAGGFFSWFGPDPNRNSGRARSGNKGSGSNASTSAAKRPRRAEPAKSDSNGNLEPEVDVGDVHAGGEAGDAPDVVDSDVDEGIAWDSHAAEERPPEESLITDDLAAIRGSQPVSYWIRGCSMCGGGQRIALAL